MMTGHYVFTYRYLDEVLLSIETIQNRIPSILEVTGFISRDLEGISGPSIILHGDCWAESQGEAKNALRLLDDLPVTKKAHKSDPYRKCEVADILKRFQDVLDNRGKRYEVDNLWTDTPMQQLLPGIHGITDDLPPAPSHLFLQWWMPKRKMPDMAFSVIANFWISFYAISDDPSDDEKYSTMVLDRISAMDEYSKGIKLGDENLEKHPAKFLSDENFQRLEAIRRKHDPDGRFHSYMGVPTELAKVNART